MRESQLPRYNPGVNPSTLAFHSFGKCEPGSPSHPPATMAMASKNELEPGKYGVGTLAPPMGYPASSKANRGSRR